MGISQNAKEVLICLFFLGSMACKQRVPEKAKDTEASDAVGKVVDTAITVPAVPQKSFRSFEGLADSTFVRLADFSDGFAFDLRYATQNNFLKEKVYDCAECYVRVKAAKALLKANKDFKEKGVRIKFFDCYRPNAVQFKMWKIVPNPQYVANPEKGSIHNKGGAVDITLETLDGEELDMGTDFDF
ncbi:MAG: M15 family metallopeptidase, partial [Bacteroidota bacterium]